jgi:hypothetical protein
VNTNDTPNALALARAILGHLAGWQLATNTVRAINEEDSATAYYVGIESPDHPGSDVSINTSRKAPQIAVFARYPRGFEPYDHGTTYSVSASMSASKTPAQLAREIERRVLAEYLPKLAECMKRKTDTELRQHRAEQLASDLAVLVGARTDYDRAEKVPGAMHQLTPENRLRFTHWPDTQGPRIEVVVSTDYTVSIDLHGIASDEARELLQWWNLKRARRQASA